MPSLVLDFSIVFGPRPIGFGQFIPAINLEFRWRSFYTAHQPSFRSQSIQLNALSVGQVIILRKLAVLKMTALIERFR